MIVYFQVRKTRSVSYVKQKYIHYGVKVLARPNVYLNSKMFWFTNLHVICLKNLQKQFGFKKTFPVHHYEISFILTFAWRQQ